MPPPRRLRERCWALPHRRRLQRRPCILATALSVPLCVVMALLFVRLYLLQMRPTAPPNAADVAPPMRQYVFPFRDLCDAAATAVRDTAAVARARAGQSATRAREAAIWHGHQTVEADGGLRAAQRWSNRTGLPLPRGRTGVVAVRYVTVATRWSSYTQAATTAAVMAGVPLDVIGSGWQWFAFIKRMGLVMSYIQEEGLVDGDVVVGLDADALFSGEDVMPSLRAFVASTAARREEHATYHVRDVRLGRRLPPVLFSAEYNCMHIQAYPDKHLCSSVYDTVDALMMEAAQDAAEARIFNGTRTNPLRYLNAGVFVARVWALRLVWAAMRSFTTTHVAFNGDTWWCDQSVLASLYLQLRWWEVRGGALDGAPRPLSADVQLHAPFQPLVLTPDGRGGPHGMPAGLIGLDHAGRYSLVISMHMEPKGVLRIGGFEVTAARPPEDALAAYLRTAAAMESAHMTELRSSHRLDISPRRNVDCEASDTAVGPPPLAGCEYRAAVLGLPDDGAATVVPLLWHFAGTSKRMLLTRFRTVFPWYTPLLWNATLRAAVVATLLEAPPTRVWRVNRSTDAPLLSAATAVLPRHGPVADISFAQLCSLSADLQDNEHTAYSTH